MIGLFAGCAVDPINALQTFSLDSSLACGITPSTTVGVDTDWTFTLNLTPQLDSNGTKPSLIHSAKVSRILLYGTPNYPLTNLSNARLYLRSDSLSETLVGQLTTFANGQKAQADLQPIMIELATALHDSVIVFHLKAKVMVKPAELDSIICRPTLTLIVEPTLAP